MFRGLLTGSVVCVLMAGAAQADWVMLDDFNVGGTGDGLPNASKWNYLPGTVSIKIDALRLRGNAGQYDFTAKNNNLITLPTAPGQVLTVEYAIRAYSETSEAGMGSTISTVWRGLGDSADYDNTKKWVGGVQHSSVNQGDYSSKTYDLAEISNNDVPIYVVPSGFDSSTTGGWDLVQDVFGVDPDGTRWTSQRIFKYGDQWYDSVERYEVDWTQPAGDALVPEAIKSLQFYGNNPSTSDDIYIDYIRYEVSEVPEPGTMALLTIGGLMLARRRK